MNELISILSEKDLRKAWLKQKFLSYEYHEELLTYYDKWCKILEEHWKKKEIIDQYPDRAKVMAQTVLPNLRQISRPGTIPTNGWKDGARTGWASSILYNISKGMDYLIDDECIGMTEEEIKEHGRLQGLIMRRAKNIEMTADDRWFDKDEGNDDDILNERYTGPIDWPNNWKSGLSPELVGAAEQDQSNALIHVPAGQPCPRTGWWFTPAHANSRRYFNQGDIFPAVEGSSYGDTFWQWSPDQTK